MRYADMHHGQVVRAIGSYADCIHEGDELVILLDQGEGELFVMCKHGEDGTQMHYLLSSLDDRGDMPEFELIKEDIRS